MTRPGKAGAQPARPGGRRTSFARETAACEGKETTAAGARQGLTSDPGFTA